jgi:recombination protein RecT
MSTELEKQEKKTIGERFLNSVITQVASDGAKMEFTPQMKQTAAQYFVKIDSILSELETKRDAQKHALEYGWKNVNMEKLARDVAHFSKMGLNPSMKNFINPIPYKNGKSNKYDITFIVGYEGLEYVAKRYAYDDFIDGYVQLVHQNDHFKPIFKDGRNNVESYEFSVENPFNRGEIIGGFWYQMFKDETLNRLKFYTLAEIEKRKPKNASAEFWGGEKTVWKDGRPAGTEKVDGWYVEMLEKTLKRMCFDHVSKDPQKIDAEFMEFNSHIEKSENGIIGNTDFTPYQEVKETVIEISEAKEEIKIETPQKEEIKPQNKVLQEVQNIEFPE